jgi:hypothetical protein
MAEKKKEWTVIPSAKEYDNERVIFVQPNIPPALVEKTKVEVVWDVPLVSDGIEAMEDFMKARYDCNLQTGINRGMRSFSTGPSYPDFIAESEQVNGRKVYTKLKPEFVLPNGEPDFEKIAATYQEAADNYVVGRVAEPGKAKVLKAKAEKLDSLDEMAKKLGYKTAEEFMAAQAAQA